MSSMEELEADADEAAERPSEEEDPDEAGEVVNPRPEPGPPLMRLAAETEELRVLLLLLTALLPLPPAGATSPTTREGEREEALKDAEASTSAAFRLLGSLLGVPEWFES